MDRVQEQLDWIDSQASTNEDGEGRAMDNDTEFDAQQFQSQLQSIIEKVRTMAQGVEGNSVALLAVLRSLECLHREIQDNLFQPSLPDNRQALYNFLRDIESEGGWPYIPRYPLKTLLNKMDAEEPENLAEE